MGVGWAGSPSMGICCQGGQWTCVCTHTHTHTMEYYSAIKKNEILPPATTWMDLEGIMLSEVSQTEKDKHFTISLICRI